MNTPETPDNPQAPHEHPFIPASERPLGYWLRTVDEAIATSMRAVFTEEGIGRRGWRTLTRIEAAPTTVAALEAAMPGRRARTEAGTPGTHDAHPHAHRPHGPGERRRRSVAEFVDDFAEHGWVAVDGETVTITASGRTAQTALLEKVSSVRSAVAGAVTPEDYATTLSSLEAIARALGWNEETAHEEHGIRGRRGHGRRFRR